MNTSQFMVALNHSGMGPASFRRCLLALFLMLFGHNSFHLLSAPPTLSLILSFITLNLHLISLNLFLRRLLLPLSPPLLHPVLLLFSIILFRSHFSYPTETLFQAFPTAMIDPLITTISLSSPSPLPRYPSFFPTFPIAMINTILSIWGGPKKILQ